MRSIFNDSRELSLFSDMGTCFESGESEWNICTLDLNMFSHVTAILLPVSKQGVGSRPICHFASTIIIDLTLV